jgi:prepilin-type N-terminal cleavage/methylation domain-containing protein
VPTPLRHNAGFTLTEILVVTVLIGLLAQVSATVALDMMPRYRLQGATKRFAWDLMRTRILAIKQNQAFTIRLADAHTYTIWRDLDGDGNVDVGEPFDKTVDIHDTLPGVTVTTGDPYPILLVYNSRGVPPAALRFTVANGSGTRNVMVRLTGKIDLP